MLATAFRTSSSPSLTPTAISASMSPSSASSNSLSNFLLSHDHLKPGHRASILSYSQTIAAYRENAAKNSNPDIQFAFVQFLLEAAPHLPQNMELVKEAVKICRKLAQNGNPLGQYTLATLLESGKCNEKGKPEYSKAFPLYLQAGKHGHADAAYRAAVYYETGRGTSRSSQRAVQFYQKAAALGHPGAMYRMGMAELHGELSLPPDPRNGVKWLKLGANSANADHPESLYQLALLHEEGIPHLIFVDHLYAVKLLDEAAKLGHSVSAFRLGSYYEHGKPGVVLKDPKKSFEYYLIAAESGHPEAMFGVASWYLTGYPSAHLPPSDDSAFMWMSRAAGTGLVKAEFALAHFYESGLGTEVNLEECRKWYESAAMKGDARAKKKMEEMRAMMSKNAETTSAKEKNGECIIM